MEKLITLPEPLLRQASETARQKGIEVDALVIEAVERYLEEQREYRVSEARRKLRELAKRMKPSENFFDGLAEARQQAYDTRTEDENAESEREGASLVESQVDEATGNRHQLVSLPAGFAA